MQRTRLPSPWSIQRQWSIRLRPLTSRRRVHRWRRIRLLPLVQHPQAASRPSQTAHVEAPRPQVAAHAPAAAPHPAAATAHPAPEKRAGPWLSEGPSRDTLLTTTSVVTFSTSGGAELSDHDSTTIVFKADRLGVPSEEAMTRGQVATEEPQRSEHSIALMSSFPRAFGRADSTSPWDSRQPVREELFSVERLEEHARSLAVAQPVTPKPTKGHPLAGRLADNGAVLLHAYRTIARAIDDAPRHHAGGRMAGRQLLPRRASRSAKSAPPCRPATIGNCRSWPTGRSRDIRGCSASPGPLSPTPTATSIPRCCAASCAPIRRCSR